MIKYYHTVRLVADQIAGAINRSVEMLREGQVEQEPAMTDRMLGAIQESLSNYSAKGIRWRAKTLTDRGRGAQESKYGADFMGVLNIDLPDFKVSKGFLAQAKLIKNDGIGDLSRLKGQCKDMLDLSPASFVFLYGPDGVRVLPAISVIGSADPFQLYHRSAQRFFEEHLECFIGDMNISSPISATLAELRDRFEARSALMLQADLNP